MEPNSTYDRAVREWRAELVRRAPGVGDVLQSDVRGRFLARVMTVVHDAHAGHLRDELPRVLVKQRTGLSQDGGFLRATGTHPSDRLRDVIWVGLARQLLALFLCSLPLTSLSKALDAKSYA